MQITNINEHYQLSIKKETPEGVYRCAFSPGEFDAVEKFAPDLLEEVKKIWTKQVISDWHEFCEKENDIYTPDFATLKENKLSEINMMCQQQINKGIEVETSKGLKHFSLSSEDQMNITALFTQLQSALKGEPSTIDINKGVPYHADGELCCYWGAEDFANIATEATKHVFYHTTYTNFLRYYVNQIATKEELETVKYGMDLPKELQKQFAELLVTR